MSKELNSKPILFSAEMVRAILEGRKTQTRRIVKPQPAKNTQAFWHCVKSTDKSKVGLWSPKSGTDAGNAVPTGKEVRCPYGSVGDFLWVRESWRPIFVSKSVACIQYRSNMQVIRHQINQEISSALESIESQCNERVDKSGPKWRPSIHMPRWASRITLEIKSIKIERLRDISEEDAKAEGVNKIGTSDSESSYRTGFTYKWIDIHGIGFDPDTWVWVIGFEVMS